MKFDIRRSFKRLIFILLGCFISAVGINAFIVPHKLLSGGVSGLAIITQYLTGIPSGYLVLLFNIPIFLYGIKELEYDFIFFSVVGVLLLSFFLILTKDLTSALNIKDILLSSIYGGVLNGIGLGIVLKNKGSMGGIDIVAVALKKRLGVNISTVSFIINLFVVLLGSIISSLEAGLYTLISMFISSRVLEYVLQGFDRKKMIMIVTDKPEDISTRIFKELGRGVTFLYGEGAYTGHNKKVIYCIITLNQLIKIKTIVFDIDPGAFLTIIDVAEVQGKGFKNIY
ncbi:Uncharacterized membrane-anchored protein YitT, contains DUF161 and DUF2179 domains [Caloramator fervidus]|uniref:Uncharacterized membrane-anchored protein YitT, contains DUF161 and DUF2179 domains n=1 Tax=Caloramator fervidus TaxID=29344 RepID=A0A1H5SLA3_9CLOT|nr:YitT family protein [Caloramator fervidus]SEF51230.1 Uncharacterized membrane-anchored protein YitT, contains DUF161 and DUF2179 domains [Caloramator fervidus]